MINQIFLLPPPSLAWTGCSLSKKRKWFSAHSLGHSRVFFLTCAIFGANSTPSEQHPWGHRPFIVNASESAHFTPPKHTLNLPGGVLNNFWSNRVDLTKSVQTYTPPTLRRCSRARACGVRGHTDIGSFQLRHGVGVVVEVDHERDTALPCAECLHPLLELRRWSPAAALGSLRAWASMHGMGCSLVSLCAGHFGSSVTPNDSSVLTPARHAHTWWLAERACVPVCARALHLGLVRRRRHG